MERSSIKLPITFFDFSVEFSQERKDGTEEVEMFGKNPEIIKMLFCLNSSQSQTHLESSLEMVRVLSGANSASSNSL